MNEVCPSGTSGKPNSDEALERATKAVKAKFNHVQPRTEKKPVGQTGTEYSKQKTEQLCNVCVYDSVGFMTPATHTVQC